MYENIEVTGYVKWELIKEGKIVDSWEGSNVVTVSGRNALASLLASSNPADSFVTHMGFGSGTTRETSSDTALEAELEGSGYERVPVTYNNPSGNILQYQATLTGLTAPTTINEAGLFNDVVGGQLIAHKAGKAGNDGQPYGFGSATLSNPSDSLQVTWQLQFN